MIDIESTTVSVTKGVTSFNYSLGNNSCGRTYQISVYAINSVGIGNKRFMDQPITCTRKGTTMSVMMMQEFLCNFKIYHMCSIARSLGEFYLNNEIFRYSVVSLCEKDFKKECSHFHENS